MSARSSLKNLKVGDEFTAYYAGIFDGLCVRNNQLEAENSRLKKVADAAIEWRDNEVGLIPDCTCEICSLMRAVDEYRNGKDE